MKPSLKAKLERLGPLPAAGPARSGSPVDLVLRPAHSAGDVRAIDAMAALTAQGVAVATAKRAIETMLDRGEVVVAAPAVDDPKRVAKTLRAAGVYARRIGAVTIDVAGLRARLGLSQAEFARRFGLDVDTVQNWEQGRTSPDRTARALLRAIDGAPEAVAAALEEELV